MLRPGGQQACVHSGPRGAAGNGNLFAQLGHRRKLGHRALARQDLGCRCRVLQPGGERFLAHSRPRNREQLEQRATAEQVEVSRVQVRRVGTDTAAAVGAARRDLCGPKGAEAVFLELPLAQAGTPELCRAAEAEGFFFSGLGPGFAADGDALRLQYLAVGLDASLLQVESAFGRELLDYVGRERQRVGLFPG